jgi:peptidoglycan/LPS O-acetylase OafA/YrhL
MVTLTSNAAGQTSATDNSRTRTDIQALRGLAILLVLLHHAKVFPWLKAGYLGVDIFFVVSGYLITGVITRALIAGTFTFKDFYVRRAKRLLPAAYVTFAGTLVLAATLLTAPEMRDFTWQLLGAVTFTANIALWMQTGYFEGAAYLKPLLHVWSLSIEEQYYLLLPAALFYTPKRFWKAALLAITVGSLALCLTLLPLKPGATFYLLPTRAWELALGSLGMLYVEKNTLSVTLARLYWPALTAVLFLPFFPTSLAHPGMDALIVCMSTLLMIMRNHDALNTGWLVGAFARLGNISYSLYLVHWPLFAFAANIWVSPVPATVRMGLMLLALLLASLLYRYVEQPFRRTDIPESKLTFASVLAVSSLIVAGGFSAYALQAWSNVKDFGQVRAANHGMGPACDFVEPFSPKQECRTSALPRIILWGDSFAMHLEGGVAASTSDGIVQATKSNCGPFLGIAHFSSSGTYNKLWADGCLKFTNSVLDYIATTPSIEVVVMASPYLQYLSGSRILSQATQSANADPSVPIEIDGDEDIAVKALVRSIAAVRASGKKVVLVAPPPAASGVDYARCLEIRTNGKLFMGADNPSCAISVAKYLSNGAPVKALLDRVSKEARVSVFSFDDYLCHGGTCAVELDGTPLYRDGGHLSNAGSRLLGGRIKLASRLLALAS